MFLFHFLLRYYESPIGTLPTFCWQRYPLYRENLPLHSGYNDVSSMPRQYFCQLSTQSSSAVQPTILAQKRISWAFLIGIFLTFDTRWTPGVSFGGHRKLK